MNEILKKLSDLEEKAKKEFNIKKLKYKIDFELKSQKCLGLFIVSGKKKTLSFNHNLILKVGEKKYLPVVTHEFAHLIARVVFGSDILPHGKEWKSVMLFFGEKNPRASTDAFSDVLFDIKAKCGCQIHGITKNRATRIKNGKKYICFNCHKKLKVIINE